MEKLTLAPKGKFRVVEIENPERQEGQKQISISNGRLVDDCDTLEQAFRLMLEAKKVFTARVVYDEKGKSRGSFRLRPAR